jgi:hypothetical protein
VGIEDSILDLEDFQDFSQGSVEAYDNRLKTFIRALFNEVRSYLGIEPFQKDIELVIRNELNLEKLNRSNVFNIGVKRKVQDDILVLEIYGNYVKFLIFIVLREIYNLFISPSLRVYELVQIVVNQIIINHLSKSQYVNDWVLLIRKNFEDYDHLSKGVTRLFEFDRLERFFKIKGKDYAHDPIQFFFRYLRNNPTLISDRIEDIHDKIFQEFTDHIISTMNNDDLVETIRCIIDIFYRVKNYQNLRSYKNFFQEFKEAGEIKTELNVSRFIKNMDSIKRNSYVAPSYQLNWNSINVCLIIVFLRFNPQLTREKVFRIINQLPFFTSLKTSSSSFAVDISGYIVIPRIYLDDFLRFLKRMKDYGYIIQFQSLQFTAHKNNLNLNYFREFFTHYRIINPSHPKYDDKYEIEFKIDFGTKFHKTELSLLDFVILDRIRFFSVSGFGFEKRKEVINQIKTDLLNEVINERSQISNFRKILTKFHESHDLRAEFLDFFEKNRAYGFFYIRSILKQYITLVNVFKKELKRSPSIKNKHQFQSSLENFVSSQLIEDNIMFHNSKEISVIVREFIDDYFKNIVLNKKRVKDLKAFYDLINSCYKMKLFNLKSIRKLLNDPKLVKSIFKTKEHKLKQHYEYYKLYKITSKEIERVLDKFLANDPPIIQPLLINTIMEFEYRKDYLQLLLTESEKVQTFIEKIKNYFPRILTNSVKDLVSNENMLYVEISFPNQTKKEREQLFSILYNNLREDLIYSKSYLWDGLVKALSRKNFYDFENKQFFYTEDLYEQFFKYVQTIFGDILNPLIDKLNRTQESFWSKERSFTNLLEKMKLNDQMKKVGLTLNNLNGLLDLHLNLKKNLLDKDKFREIKTKPFFKNYVKSIKFIPQFQSFGFKQFFLYLYPTDMSEIDFKLLFLNTFQKIKYPACLDDSNSLLIKYIMPYQTPNMKYLNWLVKTKKIIREYIAFSVRKIHKVFHLDHNFNSDGWKYDPDKFKIYMQNVLFNSDYKIQNSDVQTFSIGDLIGSKNFTPNSSEFEDLCELYNRSSVDIKSYIVSGKKSISTRITNLLREDLIFPYLSFKNLGHQEKFYIILPKIKRELNPTLIKIFSYFNIVTLYEFEGEFYIHEFPDEKRFENGLMIKIYFPKCEVSEFISLFDLLFQYLGIKHYLILNDLIDGKNLIKSVFGNLDFMKSYNPLKNLKWNAEDKVWLSPKLFTKKFEKIYPNLLFKDRTQQKALKN